MRRDGKLFYEAVYYLVVLAACVRFVDLRDISAIYPPSALELLISGGAELPFAHRVLTPEIIGAVHQLTGVGIYTLASAIEVACLFLTVLLTCRLLALFIDNPVYAKAGGAAVLLALAPSFVLIEYQNNWYAYDLPAVLLFTLGLFLIFTSRHWALLALLPIATLNRETAVFLIPIFFMVHWPDGLKRALGLSAAMLAAWLTAKLLLAAFVPASGGQTLYFSVGVNLSELIDRPLDSLQVLSVFLFVWVPLALCFPRIPYDGLKRALLGSLPFVAANFAAAIIHEVRVFGELAPLYWCAAALLFARLAGVPGLTPRAAESDR